MQYVTRNQHCQTRNVTIIWWEFKDEGTSLLFIIYFLPLILIFKFVFLWGCHFIRTRISMWWSWLLSLSQWRWKPNFPKIRMRGEKEKEKAPVVYLANRSFTHGYKPAWLLELWGPGLQILRNPSKCFSPGLSLGNDLWPVQGLVQNVCF